MTDGLTGLTAGLNACQGVLYRDSHHNCMPTAPYIPHYLVALPWTPYTRRQAITLHTFHLLLYVDPFWLLYASWTEVSSGVTGREAGGIIAIVGICNSRVPEDVVD